VEKHTVEAQLPNADSSIGNKISGNNSNRRRDAEHADMLFVCGFAMEILSLHSENISVDIRIGDNLTDIYLKRCIVIYEKQALS
jgi:hypothetical protein